MPTEGHQETQKEIGAGFLIAIGIGGTIGATIFTILGYAAGMAGPAVVISLLLGGLVTVLIGMTYSELSATFPESGGGYTFTKKAFGGMPAFLTGWLMTFANIVYGSLAALGFAHLIGYTLGLPPLWHIGIALVTLVLFSLLNLKGVKEAGQTQLVLVLILVIGLTLFIITGITSISPANLTPLVPFGWPGILEAMAFLFVGYFGFEAIATVSGEVKKPGRIIAATTIISILICALLYILIAWVAVGTAGTDQLSEAASPLVLVGGLTLGAPGMIFIIVLGAIGTLTSLNTALIASGRVIRALTIDGFLPHEFARTNHQGAPTFATGLATGVMALFIASGVVDFVAHIADFNLFLALILVSSSLIVLRRKRRVLKRPFKTSTILTLVSIGVLAILILFLNSIAIALGIAIVFFGVLIYLYTISPKINRTYTLGGIAVGGSSILLGCLWIGEWNIQLQLNGFILQLAPLLIIGCLLLFLVGLLVVVPVRRMTVWNWLTEPTRSERLVQTKKYIEIVVSIGVLMFSGFAMAVFYLVFHSLVWFPVIPGYFEGYRFLFLLSLGGFSVSGVIIGISLLRRKYLKLIER